jgi:hypothetical protein
MTKRTPPPPWLNDKYETILRQANKERERKKAEFRKNFARLRKENGNGSTCR